MNVRYYLIQGIGGVLVATSGCPFLRNIGNTDMTLY